MFHFSFEIMIYKEYQNNIYALYICGQLHEILNICKNLCFCSWCMCSCMCAGIFECGHMLYGAHGEANGNSQVPVPAFPI